MRITGVILPSNKRIVIALTYIYGIGHTTAHKICTALQLNEDLKANEITDAQALQIEDYIVANYTVESDLKGKVNNNIKKLMSISCFRGTRHKKRFAT